MNREIRKILVALMLFSVADGAFYNFQELWMIESGLSVKTVSIILSLGALISCSVIFLCSNIIKQNKLKKFILSLLLIRVVITAILFLLYKSNLKILIKFLILMDYAIDIEIFASMYPLMSIINKSDKLYGTKAITYNGFYYVGSILATFLVGKTIIGITFNYNSFAIMSILLTLMAFLLLKMVNINSHFKKHSNDDNDVLINLIKEIKKDKISIIYLLFSFCGTVSYYIIVGIVMLLLVTKLNINDQVASYITLKTGIFSALTALIILSRLTFKNNYINVGIKYIGRIVVYSISLLYTCKLTLLLSVLYTLITSSWYSHVTDAPYINRFTSEKQLAFANLKEITDYLSKSLGVLMGGISLIYSFKINYILAIFFAILAVIFQYRLLDLYNKEV